jgi:hypothetical protein
MLGVGIELTIPVFEKAKTFNVLQYAATAGFHLFLQKCLQLKFKPKHVLVAYVVTK